MGSESQHRSWCRSGETLNPNLSLSTLRNAIAGAAVPAPLLLRCLLLLGVVLQEVGSKELDWIVWPLLDQLLHALLLPKKTLLNRSDKGNDQAIEHTAASCQQVQGLPRAQHQLPAHEPDVRTAPRGSSQYNEAAAAALGILLKRQYRHGGRQTSPRDTHTFNNTQSPSKPPNQNTLRFALLHRLY